MGIGVFVIGQVISVFEKVKDVEANLVFYLIFDCFILEQINNLEIDFFVFEMESIFGLIVIVDVIDWVVEDDNIKGIFLELEQLSVIGFVFLGVICDVFVDFKKKGKFIIVYGDYYMQAGYYLVVIVDEVLFNLLGIVDLCGFFM